MSLTPSLPSRNCLSTQETLASKFSLLRGLALAGFIGVCSAEVSQGAITVTFSQNGSNVIGVVSGSWETWSSAFFTNSLPENSSFADAAIFAQNGLGQDVIGGSTFIGNNSDGWGLGNSTPLIATGDTWGIGSREITANIGYTAGTPINTVITWANQDIDLVLDASFEGAGKIMAFSGTGNQVTYVKAVPEPSSTALLGLAGLALILRRRN